MTLTGVDAAIQILLEAGHSVGVTEWGLLEVDGRELTRAQVMDRARRTASPNTEGE